jgi:hypothetical protein
MFRRIYLAMLAAVASLAAVAAAVGTSQLAAGAATAGISTPAAHSNSPAAHGLSAPLRRSAPDCAVSVGDFHSATPGDDTPAFTAAITAAVTEHPDCYPQGPSGEPQAVVYVPAGTYRLAGLRFPSNVRMEVDAAATLELPADRYSVPAGGNVSMIIWDSLHKTSPAVRNVSLVGVGSDLNDQKRSIAATGGAAMSSFDLSGDFTMNLDAAATGSTNYNTGVEVVNVQYFDIENLLTIQNATDQAAGSLFPWPTSARAVIRLHARANSPVAGPNFLQPMHGTVRNQVNINSPRGFGPNQVGAGSYLTFSDIYTRGGTALRLETDGSTAPNGAPRMGATVDHLVGRHIVGVDCNRAVSLSPHAQHNGTVDVDDVYAYSCNQAVVAAFDNDVLPQYYGSFDNASVRDVHADGGYDAQLDSTAMLWVTGESMMQVYIAPGLPWHPQIQVVSTSGPFSRTDHSTRNVSGQSVRSMASGKSSASRAVSAR